MSMSSSHSSPRQDDSSDLMRAARPIMETEAAQIEDEARQRAAESGQEVMGQSRRGRVEAEAHRISEEMTRRAQEQRCATEHPQVPPALIEAGDTLTRLFPPLASITRVLVPLSGTPFAERAIPYAVALARLTGASLSLVHVGDSPVSEPAAALERALTTLHGDAKPDVAPVAVAHAHSPTVGYLWEHVAFHLTGVEWHNLPEGPVAQSLLALVRSSCAPELLMSGPRRTRAAL